MVITEKYSVWNFSVLWHNCDHCTYIATWSHSNPTLKQIYLTTYNWERGRKPGCAGRLAVNKKTDRVPASAKQSSEPLMTFSGIQLSKAAGAENANVKNPNPIQNPATPRFANGESIIIHAQNDPERRLINFFQSQSSSGADTPLKRSMDIV
eukprot:scaffold19424_cov142-Cylindrotheca_fusiformis.AAC.2